MVTPALSTTSWLLSFRLSGCMPVRTVIVPVNTTPLLSQEDQYGRSTVRSRYGLRFWGGQCCGSGSESGSGSCYNQAKTVRKKTLFLLFCDFLLAFYLRKIMYNKHKKAFFSCHLEGHWRKYQDLEPDPESEYVSQRYGAADPDPSQNVTDPQHWRRV
jgi:hypothetical protein